MLKQPNTVPPLTTTEQALEYKAELEKNDPSVEYLMTLYLHEDMLEEIQVDGQTVLKGVHEVKKASQAGIKGEPVCVYFKPLTSPDERKKLIGIKSYPRGVTTHSSSGIESYEPYYPVFKALEEQGMTLNLHGEVPSDDKAVSA